MSVQKILQESIEKNPLGLKEAFIEELRARLGLALEAKMQGNKKDEDDKEKRESFDLSDLTLEELEDFMMSEEFEQLDEISKKTVVSYMNKAKKSQDDAKGQRFPGAVLGTKPKDPKTHGKRSAGMSNAFSKLMGTAKIKATESFDLSDLTLEELEDFMMSEEFEQLDEISTPKLARYMKRASDDLANNSANREFMKANLPSFTDKDERTKEKVDNTFKKMIGKRKAGIEKAASKIARKHSED